MPLSPTTDHTPLNLCAIIDKWLQDNQYDKLFVRHGTARCAISSLERAGNPIDIGYINKVNIVLLSSDDDYDAIAISAYDKRLFDLLIEGLKFAKP